ncbi:MAG: hypothetical protein P8168_04790, partial [Deltaproteobacteria bacterium]
VERYKCTKWEKNFQNVPNVPRKYTYIIVIINKISIQIIRNLKSPNFVTKFLGPEPLGTQFLAQAVLGHRWPE